MRMKAGQGRPAQAWGPAPFDIGFEAFTIVRTVEHKGRLDAIMSKGGHKGHGFPVAVRNFGKRALPLAAVH